MRMNAILWPEGHLPGHTDNFVSNELIEAGLDAASVWPWLSQPARWPTYCANAAQVRLHAAAEELSAGMRFDFHTFGFAVAARCTEYQPPRGAEPGRVSWRAWSGAEGSDERLDVHHAWLIEDLEGGRVRILTQETQNGKPARQLRAARPDPMLNGHQAWLDGLVAAARGRPMKTA